MSQIVLDKPLFVYDQQEVHGDFVASKGFRLSGGDLGNGETAFGILTVVPGSKKPKLHGSIDGSALDLKSPDWQVNQVRGVHVPRCDDVEIRDLAIRNTPREAIYCAGVRGLEVSQSRSEKTESFLNLDYFTGVHRRPNSWVYVHSGCQHRNGSSYGVVGPEPIHKLYESVLEPGRYIGGNGINGTANDVEISGFTAAGEYKGAVKFVSSERVRIVGCIGSFIMLQGSTYFAFEPVPEHGIEPGPHSINGAAGQLPHPYGPKHYSKDLTIEGCTIDPNLSLWKSVDDPLGGGNTFQLSWPQQRTRILNNNLWWEPGPPAQPSIFACIQLSQTGFEVEIRGNRFQNVLHPLASHGIHMGDHPQYPGFWPSSRNADWASVNTFVPPGS